MRWRGVHYLAWSAGVALLLLVGLAWHFEAASRLDLEALDPRPGPLVVDRAGRVLRLAPEAAGRKLVKLADGDLPEVVAGAFIAAVEAGAYAYFGKTPPG